MLDNKNIQKIFSLGDIRKKQLLGEVPERTRETYREYGYFGGGQPGPLSTVDRIDYSNDTATTTVRGPLSLSRYYVSSTSNSNFGYFGGGLFSFPGLIIYSTVDRINYSNDGITASVRGPLSSIRWGHSSTGNSNFGYFGGGKNTNLSLNFSSIERINYSNDLVVPNTRGSLSSARSYLSSSGNNNFVYFGGGRTNTNISIIDRINYLNDTQTALVRGPLSSNKQLISASGNSNFSYFTGGSSPTLSTVDRIDYSNDTQTASVRGPLSLSRYYHSGSGNSNFGYFCGGGNPSVPAFYSIVDRIDYSNDTSIASVRGPLSTAKLNLAASSPLAYGGAPNSSFASNFTFPTVPNAGYFGGGSDGTNDLATIDKVDYANDTATASVRSALSIARQRLAATGNSNFGYFGGGFTTGPTLYSTVDRIEYRSDTQNTTTRGPLTVARGFISAAGNSNFGYFSGGFVPGFPGASSTVDRIDYSTDTSAASPRGLLILERSSLAATGNQNFGYFAGGLSPATSSANAKSEIQRIDYSADLMSSLNRSTLTGSRYVLATTGNNNFGYFGGGSFPASISFSNIQRLDYSNDTETSINRGNLSTSKGRISATGNSNFGYFGGGATPSSTFSTTDRINYSNDTAVASIRGPLSTEKSFLAATSPLAYGGAAIYFTNPLPQVLQNQITFNDANTLQLPFKRVLGSFGYFGGGLELSDFALSTVDRIDYSNDTSTASVRGPLSFSTYRFGAAGNTNYGYYAGGGNPSVSTVSRIDYSNDNVTGSTRGPLSRVRDRHYATGNNNFGYFGNSAYSITSIDRINYSNDNTSELIRGSLTSARAYGSATGNSNFGYFGGGRITVPETSFSSVDRINYSNDNQTLSIRGSLSLARWGLTASGNSNFGYFGAGGTAVLPASFFTTVDRIDYSNDTATALVRGPLSIERSTLAATGNSNFGYFGGVSTTVDRIDYSNDTSISSVRGPLSSGRNILAATTNARSS